MSSGSSSFSSFQSHPVIETNRKGDLKSDIKVHDLEIKKNIEKSDINLKQPFVNPPKYPSSTTTTNQLHHYARSLVMVQR